MLINRKRGVYIIQSPREMPANNIAIIFACHVGISILYFYLMDLRLSDEAYFIIEIISLVTYVLIPYFLKDTNHNRHDLIAASTLLFVGLIFWGILAAFYYNDLLSNKEIVFFGPQIIWVFYIPFTHGFSFLFDWIFENSSDYWLPIPFLLLNFLLSFIYYLSIKFKRGIKRLWKRIFAVSST